MYYLFDKKVRIKQATLTINPIRLNWHYVIWYKNFTVILLSLVVPFILLAYWNGNTLAVMIRRYRLAYRPALRSNIDVRTNLAISLPTNEEVAAALLNGNNRIQIVSESSASRQGNSK